MSRGPDFEPREPTPQIPSPQGRGRERFSLKSESGDASMTGVLISMGVGFSILLGVSLYPVISDRVFGKRVENYCVPPTLLHPAYCYNDVTPEGEK